MSAGGQLRLWRNKVFVGHALVGQDVGLQPLPQGARERYWRVYFMGYALGVVDSQAGRLWTPTEWNKRVAPEAADEGRG